MTDFEVDVPEQQTTDTHPGHGVLFEEPEPYATPVDGVELLDDLAAVVERHIIISDAARDALALWVLHTYTHEAAFISPILAVTSPERRCGKTTLLTLLQGLVHRPLPAGNISPASVFRVVEQYQPTLLIDEADTFLKQNEELRGIINCGHSRLMAKVIRTVGEKHEVRVFNTWAPKAIAIIGRLHPTLMDRSIVVPMKRKHSGDRVERLRLHNLTKMRDFQSRCIRWAEDHLEWLEAAEPVIPVDLHDRAADNWEPLLAIADSAGGDWPHRARKAAIILSSDEPEETAGVMLLADIQQIFEARRSTRLKSSELVAALTEMEERPWSEWRNGKTITPAQVARLLKPFGIKPKNIRDVSVFKGYEQSDFDDALSRYLPVSPATPLQDCKNRVSADFSAATQPIAVADKNMQKPLENKLCSVVAGQETGVGGNHCQGIDTGE